MRRGSPDIESGGTEQYISHLYSLWPELSRHRPKRSHVIDYFHLSKISYHERIVKKNLPDIAIWENLVYLRVLWKKLLEYAARVKRKSLLRHSIDVRDVEAGDIHNAPNASVKDSFSGN